MKILFMCGDYPPNSNCATADTSFIMVNILQKRGFDVELLTNVSWSLKNFLALNKIVKSSNADAMFIPYATMGYKHSIVPQLLSFIYKKKIVVLIHEVSQVFILRKLSLIPFSFCNSVVFTNQFERAFFHKIYPWTPPRKTKVIPIGSNISSYNNLDFDNRCYTNIVYFGQIRPQKGIEQIIQLARLIKENNLPFSVIIMGRKLETSKNYYEQLVSTAKNLEIDWKINIDEKEVSKVLGSNAIAYLPFPDGASERRGTLFAALIHKMIIFTNKGEQTIKELDACTEYVSTPEELIEILSSNTLFQDLRKLSEKHNIPTSAFLHKYDWEVIMDEYICLFEKIAQCRR